MKFLVELSIGSNYGFMQSVAVESKLGCVHRVEVCVHQFLRGIGIAFQPMLHDEVCDDVDAVVHLKGEDLRIEMKWVCHNGSGGT